MKKNNDFFVPYIEGSLGASTKKTLKTFTIVTFLVVIVGALVFSFSQKPFKNSTFELTSATKITGVFHENPYPMLRVEVEKNNYKNILLLGFGKSSANPFLDKLITEVGSLDGKNISIEGNLIYYNGKTLIQITDDEKVILEDGSNSQIPSKEVISEMTLQGEIIDPKCYFGVMKPGKGKIHRSCAVRCISGGIPPVLATSDNNNISEYYLLTDLNGNPINEAVLPFIGKPSEIKGIVERQEDWYILKIDPKDIKVSGLKSTIY
ncbi:hypothetical protein RM697_10075 [Ichthyenterobacterium sp. W332]|uniref:Uncharacterized protein n=1 Tax=Microcosmobacter mediterraneus TaxID=3075607 RepID=A0ABU2YLH6_9FLAO|nr:hypothetical protein [Ichthyenterobacterium sp. W332]MDT0558996.1 hypothetical protein [Ichthyenterobacterium sp. W332]